MVNELLNLHAGLQEPLQPLPMPSGPLPVGQTMPPSAPDLPETMAVDLDMTPRGHANEDDREELTLGPTKRFGYELLRTKMMLSLWSLVFRKICCCLSCHVAKKQWLRGKPNNKAVVGRMIYLMGCGWVSRRKMLKFLVIVSPGSTHGDFALETGVDFLAFVEHWLIPARVRSEWSSLKGKGLASIWAQACQNTVVVSLKGAPVSMATFATALTCCRAIKCLLPIRGGMFLNLVVLYGYQGSDADAGPLALTE